MKSWKTTVMGAVVAGLTVIHASQKPSWQSALKDQTIQIELATAVALALSKDYDATGPSGSTRTPRERN